MNNNSGTNHPHSKKRIYSFISNHIHIDLPSTYSNFCGTSIYPEYFNESLYNILSSDNSTYYTLINILDKTDLPGVIDFIMNKISHSYQTTSFSFVPQLVNLLSIKSNSKAIESYLIDRCLDQMKFSMIINWNINSIIEDIDNFPTALDTSNLSKDDKEVSQIINQHKSQCYSSFSNELEISLVNGIKSSLSKQSAYLRLNKVDNGTIIVEGVNKEIRSMYFAKVNQFYFKLKNMCEELKNFPKDKQKGQNVLTRNEVMRKTYNEFNNEIRAMYEQEIGEKKYINIDKILLFRGIILPFNSKSIDDLENTIIVRIIPEKSACFSTKARVPVKTIVECVSVWECQEWDALYKHDNDNNSKNNNGELNTITTEQGEGDEFIQISKMNGEFKEKLVRVKTMPMTPSNEIETNENIKEINKILELIKKEDEGLRKYNTFKSISVSQTETDETINEDFLNLISSGEFNPFGEKWSDTVESIKSKSPFREFTTYSVKSFIAKANDDLRQEVMTMQLIEEFDKVFKLENTNLRLRPYEILITSSSSGLIEFLPNSISIDGLKKQLQPKGTTSLSNFFKGFFKNKFQEAQRNFACSLAAYSLVCYFLSIKDRHNGNIMLDMNGYIVHIDYGFILGISPGNNRGFETAPFKFTREYLEILEGEDSQMFEFFVSEFYKGFRVARKYYKHFENIISLMCVEGSSMPCFVGKKPKEVIKQFREKFYLHKSQTKCLEIVRNIIKDAMSSHRTSQYDYFQLLTNGILK